MTHYLKFLDEAEAQLALAEFSNLTIDYIGEVSNATGYHVNTLGDLPESLIPFEAFPLTTSREFAL